jgi:hypothetical protein
MEYIPQKTKNPVKTNDFNTHQVCDTLSEKIL